MTSSYYIYYKVTAAQAAQVRQAVTELQRSLGSKTGIQGRLLCRRDQADTWMEIYENVQDERAFEAALAEDLERIGFGALLGAGASRYTEVFRPL